MNNTEDVKKKGLKDYLMEDPSLTEQIDYDEFVSKKAAPDNTDAPLEDVYMKYRRIIAAL